jgi:hypothetical protein
LLSIGDILGIIVLAGPLIVVLLGLIYFGAKTGFEDLKRKTKDFEFKTEKKDVLEIPSIDQDTQEYIQEIKRKQNFSEIEENSILYIRWLFRIVITAFALLSFEAIRTFYILWYSESPFTPHALVVGILSSSIVVISIYYGIIRKT